MISCIHTKTICIYIYIYNHIHLYTIYIQTQCTHIGECNLQTYDRNSRNG